MAYSKDFRQRAIEYMEKGHSEKELQEAFGIRATNVRRWRKLLSKSGSLKPQYRETRRRKIDGEKLKQAVERKPDATLAELAAQFNCTSPSIHAALKRQKITVKKRLSPTKSKIR
jgi:transposase